jgi:hypothetical protein
VNPHFNKEDLAIGTIDLYADYIESATTPAPLRSNSSIIERAATLVKEAAPQLIEVMINNLATPSPVDFGTSMSNFGTPSPYTNHTGTGLSIIPNVVISKLPETIVVIPPSGNSTTTFLQPTDQVVNFDCVNLIILVLIVA